MLSRQASTARVLLVNDDSFELATMAASLRLHSVNVVGEASNKFIAENLFRSLEPEVVLIHASKVKLALFKFVTFVFRLIHWLVPFIEIALLNADVDNSTGSSGQLIKDEFVTIFTERLFSITCVEQVNVSM